MRSKKAMVLGLTLLGCGAALLWQKGYFGWAASQWTEDRNFAMSDLNLTHPRIVVIKHERRLDVYDGDRLAACYRIGLGGRPEGHKQREGDNRTPEGQYYVCAKNPHSRFHLSLGLSYPNADDAAAALAGGAIDRATHEAIIEAVRDGRTPPWNTVLGGEVFIHGRGSMTDWTAGCIALDDADIEQLYGAIPVGTPVEIRP